MEIKASIALLLIKLNLVSSLCFFISISLFRTEILTSNALELTRTLEFQMRLPNFCTESSFSSNNFQGNDEGFFSIDESSGDIMLNATLDYETKSVYHLKIKVLISFIFMTNFQYFLQSFLNLS